MNAVPPRFTPALGPADAAGQWSALEDAAALVATLAGLAPESRTAHVGAVAALLAEAEAWRRDQAERAVADLTAIMEAGLAALIAVNTRGADPQPAALTLWREFAAARAAIVALLSPGTRAHA